MGLRVSPVVLLKGNNVGAAFILPNLEGQNSSTTENMVHV